VIIFCKLKNLKSKITKKEAFFRISLKEYLIYFEQIYFFAQLFQKLKFNY